MTKFRLAIRATCVLFGMVGMIYLAQGQGGGGPQIVPRYAEFSGPTYYSATVSESGLIFQEVTTFKAGENRYVVFALIADPTIPDAKQVIACDGEAIIEQLEDANGNPPNPAWKAGVAISSTPAGITKLGEKKPVSGLFNPPTKGKYEIRISWKKNQYKQEANPPPGVIYELQPPSAAKKLNIKVD